MTTYAEYLADKIQQQEQRHEGRCYHVLPHEERKQNFVEVIVAFCKQYNIQLVPADQVEKEPEPRRRRR